MSQHEPRSTGPSQEFLEELLRSPAVLDQLSFSCEIIQWMTHRIHDRLSIETTTQTECALAAIDLVHEHYISINQLIRTGRIGSAYALLRSQFEALVRAIWLLRGSDEQAYQAWARGEGSIEPSSLLTAIRKKSRSDSDQFLADTWKTSKKTLHQFTHVSYQLLARRMSGVAEEHFHPTEIADALRFAAGTCLLSCLELASLAEDDELAAESSLFLARIYPTDKS
ncbi:DUF6988 family protein [Xanthomonas prunicola]|nr:hypothetical protein [Xanthomonas prunicola]